MRLGKWIFEGRPASSAILDQTKSYSSSRHLHKLAPVTELRTPRLLLRRARPDVPRLSVDIDPRNEASIRLVKRYGFVETGRASGTWTTHIGLCDSVYLALEKADWLVRSGQNMSDPD